MNDFANRYLVAPGSRPSLRSLDPGSQELWDSGKKTGEERVEELSARIGELQELLFADGSSKVLVLLQGMDTSGKDGTVRKVFDGVTPLGVNVVAFKAPTTEERSHDFLWRVHSKVPGSGELTVFNRSHYEDVLVVRVRGLAPEKVWRPRYRQIREFESLLTSTGTLLLKFFLFISKEEQRERLQARIDDPAKHWKFNAGDLEERRHWDEYQTAYEDALGETSTKNAPWYIVPADRKWYRNLVIAEIVASKMEQLKSKPPTVEGVAGLVVE